jgi:hypothetical protein
MTVRFFLLVLYIPSVQVEDFTALILFFLTVVALSYVLTDTWLAFRFEA